MEDIVDIVLVIIFIVVPIIIGKATKKNGKQGQQQRQAQKPNPTQQVRQQMQQQNPIQQRMMSGYGNANQQNQMRPQNMGVQSNVMRQQSAAVPPNSVRQDDRMPMPVAQRNNVSHQSAMYQQMTAAQLKSANQYNASKKNMSIVEKAKMNNAKLAQDETLKEIEALHSHQEKHEAEKVQHSAACQTLKTDADAILAEESVLGTIDELMAKGYSGNLNFDRDFVGEAMDMISSFTVPDMVPDYGMPGSDV